jgi:hypothetical protein
MYTNILLSTDGSDVARKGVEHGIALAKALNAKCPSGDFVSRMNRLAS